MQLHTVFVNTCDFPETLEFLKNNYPSVLKTQCFNDKNLPFETEVVATEIGHLFEHILIDTLCSLKIKKGARTAIFNGTTSWNWLENPRGSFLIYIDACSSDYDLLIEALKLTINLTKNLMEPSHNALMLESAKQENLRASINPPAEN